ALGFTYEETSKLKPEVIQNILASHCADPIPGFEGFVTPCDLTSPTHRKAIIEFWSEGLEEYEGIESKITFDHPAPAARFKVDHIDLPAAGDPSAIHIPPALKLECVKLDDGVEKNSPGLAAAVREACAVYARTGRMLDAALIYAKHGVPIFPVDHRNKRPIPKRDPDPTGKLKDGIPGTGGFYKATCDPIIITRWWKRDPHALIALPMGPKSGIWCIDVDTGEEHVSGIEEWSALLAEHEPFETREHRSATGGP